jgi:hypothetical protein
VYPEQNALLVNLPEREGITTWQLVMNTETGAWTRFEGWNGLCFAQQHGVLYLGGLDGNVYRVWREELYNDAGTAIEGLAQTSFQYFGTHPGLKGLCLFRPHISYNGIVTVSWGLAKDYRPDIVRWSTTTAQTGPLWDTSSWDTSSWDNEWEYERQWRTIDGDVSGALALILEVSSSTARVAWTGTDFVVQQGGLI